MFELCTFLEMQHHAKKPFHQVTTVLGDAKNVLFPGHNHLLTTSTDDPSLTGTRVMMKVLGHQQYWWLAGGYDLEIGHFWNFLVDSGLLHTFAHCMSYLTEMS